MSQTKAIKLPAKGALRRDLWWVVIIKACLLFLLWVAFVRPYEQPVSNKQLTQHVVKSTSPAGLLH